MAILCLEFDYVLRYDYRRSEEYNPRYHGLFIIPQTKANRLNRENETNDESIKLELKCVSLLCDNWAGPDFLKKKNDFEYKMPHFRDAIIAGQGSGTPEHTPFEFLADDYEAVYTAPD